MAADRSRAAGDRAAILIPARLASTRLPDKPLADIKGLPMIERVWRQANAAKVGPVIVATADREIVHVIARIGGVAILTDPALPSGSDRIAAALASCDPECRYDTVINLQGDMPLIEPTMISRCLDPLDNPSVDIATLVTPVEDEADRNDPNAVKAIVEFEPGSDIGRARDFRRLLPDTHVGVHYHHIGIYAYRRTALETFVKLPLSPREKAEKLEQLRALDAGMRIDAARVDTIPIGVDTPADLEVVRSLA